MDGGAGNETRYLDVCGWCSLRRCHGLMSHIDCVIYRIEIGYKVTYMINGRDHIYSKNIALTVLRMVKLGKGMPIWACTSIKWLHNDRLFLPPPWGLYFVLNENLLCYIVSGFLYGLIECSQSSVAETIVLEATVALYMEHLPTYIERSMHSGDYLLGSPIPGKEQWRNIDEMSKFGCCFPGIGDPRTKSPLWWLQMRVYPCRWMIASVTRHAICVWPYLCNVSWRPLAVRRQSSSSKLYHHQKQPWIVWNPSRIRFLRSLCTTSRRCTIRYVSSDRICRGIGWQDMDQL